MKSILGAALLRPRISHPHPDLPVEQDPDQVPAGTPIGVVLHEIALAPDRFIVLDVAAAMAWEVAPGRLSIQVSAESPAARLVRLDWCRRRMPIPTATALWQLEGGALAAAVAEPALWAEFKQGVLAALTVLRRGSDRLPEHLGPVLTRLAAALAAEAGPTTELAELLAEVIDGLRGLLRARPVMAPSGSYRGALDLEPAGCAEAEWAAVPWFRVDPREHALRARVSAARWSASVPAQPDRRGRTPTVAGDRLWARLLDLGSGRILATAECALTDGVWVADGPLLDGPPAHWRVDLCRQPDAPVRGPADLARSVAEQAVFRADLVARAAHIRPDLGEWAQVLADRADRRLRDWLAATATRPVLGSCAPARRVTADRFLAEELVDPARVALFVSRP